MNTIYANHLLRGANLFAQNRIPEAMIEFNKAIEIDDTSFVPYQWRIMCNIFSLDGSNQDKERTEKIISDLEKSLPLAKAVLEEIS